MVTFERRSGPALHVQVVVLLEIGSARMSSVDGWDRGNVRFAHRPPRGCHAGTLEAESLAARHPALLLPKRYLWRADHEKLCCEGWQQEPSALRFYRCVPSKK